MAYCSPTSPRPKKSRLQKSKIKTLLVAFFDNKGIIYKEFVPTGETINAVIYQAVLNRLLQRIRGVQPKLHRPGKWMLLHDSAPVHSAIRVRQFLAQNIVAVLVALTLSLRTSSCFPAQGARFADVNPIKARVTAVLRSIQQKAFANIVSGSSTKVIKHVL